MKRIGLTIILTVSTMVVIFSTSSNVAAFRRYCDTCCGTDPYGSAVKQCTLAEPVMCGDACQCPNRTKPGFACYGF